MRRLAVVVGLHAAGAVGCGRIGFDNRTAGGDGDAAGTGDGPVVPVVDADPTSGLATHVYAGYNHTCAILAGGAVRCWGLGAFGELGYGNVDSIGDTELPSVAGDVPLGGVAVELALGAYHTCARLDTGSVRCWGRNSYGELGYGNLTRIGDDEPASAAGDVPLGATAIQITAGENHTCALLTGGTLRCWGQGAAGALGRGNTQDVGDDEPASAGTVPVGGNPVEVDAGALHTCARFAGGAVRCWGYGMRGQLGYGNVIDIGDNEPASAAGDVPIGGSAVELAAGVDHTCARLATGAVRCWGRGDFGQLGYGNQTWIGDTEPASAGGDLPLGGTAVQLAAGFWHSCALLDSGALRCWGSGFVGTLGYGNQDDVGDDEPAAAGGDVPIGGGVAEVNGSGDHMCAVMQSGAVRCWGHGNDGKLGHGDTNWVGDNEPASAGGDVRF